MRTIGVILATLLIVNTLGMAAGQTSAEGIPEECRVPETQLTGSEQALCDDIREKNRAIQDLSSELNSTQSEANGTGVNYHESIDQWNRQTEEPAVFIWRERDPDASDPDLKYGIFIYVGEGFGDTDMDSDGTKSWQSISTRSVGGDGNADGYLEIQLPYAPAGVNQTQQMSFSETPGVLREVAGEMNTPAGFAAYNRYRGSQERSKSDIKTGVFAILGILLPIVGMAGIYGEAKSSKLRNFLIEMDKKKRRYDGTYDDISTWQAFKEAWRDR